MKTYKHTERRVVEREVADCFSCPHYDITKSAAFGLDEPFCQKSARPLPFLSDDGQNKWTGTIPIWCLLEDKV